MKNMLAVAVALLVGCASPGDGSMNSGGQESKIACGRVTKGPTLDGRADDDAWKNAPVVETTVRGVFPANQDKSTSVRIQSVHTDTHVYLLVRWKDETKDDTIHKPWVWDAAKNAYAEGPEREDMFSVAFELSGPFDADMLSGVEAVWDVWHWKASRTNPQGFAMDRSHHYTKEQWQGKGKSFKAKNGQTIWIARPEDAGDTVEKKQAAPKEQAGDRVPQYLQPVPSGSAGDVRAKGAWADGWWTLEFERKLDTGHPDDTTFELGRAYKMAVSAHDKTGDMDKASGVLEIVFSR
jgi:hypothetical protein